GAGGSPRPRAGGFLRPQALPRPGRQRLPRPPQPVAGGAPPPPPPRRRGGGVLSQTGRGFVAGILAHLPGLLALTCPSVNSYRRLAPNMWSSAYTCWCPAKQDEWV